VDVPEMNSTPADLQRVSEKIVERTSCGPCFTEKPQEGNRSFQRAGPGILE